MAGRAWPWGTLTGNEQAAWVHAAVAVRDRLTLGMSHAYRPEDDRSSDMPSTTLHGGSDEPNITATDDADTYARLRAEGREDVEWTGDGPAPESEAERVEREQREREAAAAKLEQQREQPAPAKRGGRSARDANSADK